MYRFFRNTHLVLGITAFLFVLMYGVSAVQMAHQSWFSMKPAVTETRVAIPAGVTDDPRAIAQELTHQSMRGELRDVEKTEAGYKFSVSRPGTVYEVAYSKMNREARVRVNTAGFMGMLNRIHHVGGVWHGYWLINVWGVCVGLVSASLILLGATGIYLWFKTHGERVVGVILLVINLGVCVTLLVLIRTA